MINLTPEELWDNLTNEVREYMANRYFQTTRCCLKPEDIQYICEEEINFLNHRNIYLNYKEWEE